MHTPRHIYFLLCLKWACGATRKRLAGLTSTLIFSVLRTTVVLQKAILSYRNLSNSCMASALSHAVRLYIYNFAAWMHECQLLWSVHRCSDLNLTVASQRAQITLRSQDFVQSATVFALVHFEISRKASALHHSPGLHRHIRRHRMCTPEKRGGRPTRDCFRNLPFSKLKCQRSST